MDNEDVLYEDTREIFSVTVEGPRGRTLSRDFVVDNETWPENMDMFMDEMLAIVLDSSEIPDHDCHSGPEDGCDCNLLDERD